LPGLIRGNDAGITESSARIDESRSGEENGDPVQAAVRTFKEILGTVTVLPDSNFFELGGHSLLAVEWLLAFEKVSGKRITITQFLNHPTPRGIASILDASEQEPSSYIYPVSDKNTGLPVFVFSASKLAYALKPERPDWAIYGVQLRWRDESGEEVHYHDIEDLAARIAAELRSLCGTGDFILVGSSFPAMVAFEVARQLRADGRTPRLTILLEPSLFAGVRTWIEQDLVDCGYLREGDNHLLRWLLLNNPLRARFWRRLQRLFPSRPAQPALATQEDAARTRQVAYETARRKTIWQRYRPAEYTGPALLLVGDERGWQYRRDWERILDRKHATLSLDTNHEKILREPFLSDVVVPLLSKEIDGLTREERSD
jgi:thioesterase domain-containing protein/acyl carrier protein